MELNGLCASQFWLKQTFDLETSHTNERKEFQMKQWNLVFGQYLDSTYCIQTVLLYLICKTLAVTHLPLQKLPFK